MAEETSQTQRSSTRRESAGIGDVVDFVKEYAKQRALNQVSMEIETLGFNQFILIFKAIFIVT